VVVATRARRVRSRRGHRARSARAVARSPVVRCTLVAPVRSQGGTEQGVISGDAPRRRHDDRAEEAAWGGGVPAVGGGLGVLRLETEARG
jgi:hypothetical protein